MKKLLNDKYISYRAVGKYFNEKFLKKLFSELDNYFTFYDTLGDGWNNYVSFEKCGFLKFSIERDSQKNVYYIDNHNSSHTEISKVDLLKALPSLQQYVYIKCSTFDNWAAVKQHYGHSVPSSVYKDYTNPYLGVDSIGCTREGEYIDDRTSYIKLSFSEWAELVGFKEEVTPKKEKKVKEKLPTNSELIEYAQKYYTRGVLFNSNIVKEGERIVEPYHEGTSEIEWKVVPYKGARGVYASSGLISNYGNKTFCSNPYIYTDEDGWCPIVGEESFVEGDYITLTKGFSNWNPDMTKRVGETFQLAKDVKDGRAIDVKIASGQASLSFSWIYTQGHYRRATKDEIEEYKKKYESKEKEVVEEDFFDSLLTDEEIPLAKESMKKEKEEFDPITIEGFTFCHGDRISCEIEGAYIEEGIISLKGLSAPYICQNVKIGNQAYDLMGKAYSWTIKRGLSSNDVTNVKFLSTKRRRIADLTPPVRKFKPIAIDGKTFNHGDKISCDIIHTPVIATISLDGSNPPYLCQDKVDGSTANDLLGHKYSWSISSGINRNNVKNLKFLSKFGSTLTTKGKDIALKKFDVKTI